MSSQGTRQSQAASGMLVQATQAWRKLLSGYTTEEREVIHHRPVVLSSTNMKHNSPWGTMLVPRTTIIPASTRSMSMAYRLIVAEAPLMIYVALSKKCKRISCVYRNTTSTPPNLSSEVSYLMLQINTGSGIALLFLPLPSHSMRRTNWEERGSWQSIISRDASLIK